MVDTWQERRNALRKIKMELEAELDCKFLIEGSEHSTGDRRGTRMYVNLRKKHARFIEVIVDQYLNAYLGIAIKNSDPVLKEETKIVISLMQENGFMLYRNQTNPRFYYSKEAFVDAYELLSTSDSLADASERRISRTLFKRHYSPFLIAIRYKHAIENEDQLMLDYCRFLLSADAFDEHISVNRKTDELDYREHLVPCVCLHNRLIEVFLATQQLEELVDIIESYLKIAYIRSADAHRLDYDLGLKVKMPENWKWGDSVFARLEIANIGW